MLYNAAWTSNGITDIARFLTDEAAAQQALADLRWPDGNVTCPLCEGGKKVYEVKQVRKDQKATSFRASASSGSVALAARNSA